MKYLSLYTSLVLCCLTGCVESITNNIDESSAVQTSKDLPKCDSQKDGLLFWIKDESVSKICSDGKWLNIFDSKDEVNLKYTCETRQNKDNMSWNVYCNGDSVGVIFNGLNGLHGSGCEVLEHSENYATINCGKKSFAMYFNENRELPVLMENLILSGYSQKGPFVNGSDVMIYELANGKNLSQTGKIYKGNIVSNDGLFNINVLSLASQYVALKGSGYYLNEITGTRSNGPISLNAITDLTERSTININVLTHLEYQRVQEIVKQQNVSLAKAKDSAKIEIFKVFHIDGSKFGSSEDMNILAEGDENGALLAISILLQRDNGVANLTKDLSTFSSNLAANGLLKDEILRAQMADWAHDIVQSTPKDNPTGLARIRKNIENWKLGSVPTFEPYIQKYWYMEYGLGPCTDKEENIIKHDTLSQSKYFSQAYNYNTKQDSKIRFVCRNKQWQLANEREKDIFQWRCSDNNLIDENGVKHSPTSMVPGRINKSSKYSCINGEIILQETIIDYNNKQYPAVRFGNKLWFLRNLDFIPEEYWNDAWRYTGDDNYASKYGSLYDWEAASHSCPNGWRLPTPQEWEDLYAFSGSVPETLQAKSWDNGTDNLGFGGLPAGMGHGEGIETSVGHVMDVGDYTFWWTSEDGTLWYHDSENPRLRKWAYNRDTFSVRCVNE